MTATDTFAKDEALLETRTENKKYGLCIPRCILYTPDNTEGFARNLRSIHLGSLLHALTEGADPSGFAVKR